MHVFLYVICVYVFACLECLYEVVSYILSKLITENYPDSACLHFKVIDLGYNRF